MQGLGGSLLCSTVLAHGGQFQFWSPETELYEGQQAQWLHSPPFPATTAIRSNTRIRWNSCEPITGRLQCKSPFSYSLLFTRFPATVKKENNTMLHFHKLPQPWTLEKVTRLKAVGTTLYQRVYCNPTTPQQSVRGENQGQWSLILQWLPLVSEAARVLQKISRQLALVILARDPAFCCWEFVFVFLLKLATTLVKLTLQLLDQSAHCQVISSANKHYITKLLGLKCPIVVGRWVKYWPMVEHQGSRLSIH